jgi:hypothetical protein
LLAISGSRIDLRWKPNLLDSLLAIAFDVLAYGQRGLGRSSKPDRHGHGEGAAAVASTGTAEVSPARVLSRISSRSNSRAILQHEANPIGGAVACWHTLEVLCFVRSQEG